MHGGDSTGPAGSPPAPPRASPPDGPGGDADPRGPAPGRTDPHDGADRTHGERVEALEQDLDAYETRDQSVIDRYERLLDERRRRESETDDGDGRGRLSGALGRLRRWLGLR